MNQSEEYYDAEIAPKLAELARLCTNNRMSFVAAIEIDNKMAEISMFYENYSFAIKLVAMAVRACGNVDALFIACSRWAKKHGGENSSIILHQLENMEL